MLLASGMAIRIVARRSPALRAPARLGVGWPGNPGEGGGTLVGRRAVRVTAVVAFLVTSLAASTPARADYAANDPQDATTKMDIRKVASQVYWGSYRGHRTKIVRLKVVFSDPVPWSKLHSPVLAMPMDSRGTVAFDFGLVIFRQKIPGDPNRMHCWLKSVTGEVVLSDQDVVGFSASGTIATCAFPKRAIKARPSGIVRWRVQSRYATDAAGTKYKYDDAPDDHVAVYPHL
jgi:hypothetical protein